jgi:peptide/nickel transport system ATP-binding protein
MLKANGLSYKYAPNAPWLVRDFSLTIAPREFVGLMAPSGRGKTTIAKMLAGYLLPMSGSVTVNDSPLPQHGYCPVQMVFQAPEAAINPRWRMAQVLQEGYAPDPQVLSSLGITEAWLTRWPHELSGGELQRFALARVLNPQTRYLVADEMSTMLDAITQAQLWNAVKSFALQHDMGVLVISHESKLLDVLCDRIVTL